MKLSSLATYSKIKNQVEEAEQKLYLPANKRAVSIPTKDGYDYLISKWYHPDEYEAYEIEVRKKLTSVLNGSKVQIHTLQFLRIRPGRGSPSICNIGLAIVG